MGGRSQSMADFPWRAQGSLLGARLRVNAMITWNGQYTFVTPLWNPNNKCSVKHTHLNKHTSKSKTNTYTQYMKPVDLMTWLASTSGSNLSWHREFDWFSQVNGVCWGNPTYDSVQARNLENATLVNRATVATSQLIKDSSKWLVNAPGIKRTTKMNETSVSYFLE